MATDPLFSDQLRRSVIVTGTHYSATTLVGRLLHTAREFHLLHEPLNPEPTLSYDSLAPGRWFEFYDDTRFAELVAELETFLSKGPVLPQIALRIGRARSKRQALQALRYAQRKLPFLLRAKPAVLKDPFLAFSARTLQQRGGLKIVLCLRHPGAFAESFLRKAGSFDFADLANQPALIDCIPEEREHVLHFANQPHPPIAQAALLWRVVYGFAHQHYAADPRTLVVRQEDFIKPNLGKVQALLRFAGATESAATRRFIRRNFSAEAADMENGDYLRRDPRQAALKWRDRLDVGDLATLRDMTGELAEAYGYDAESWPH